MTLLPTSPPATHARTASALVIDDEAPARDELSYLLRTTFSIAPVDTAENSSDAFRYLQERSYNVVFLDVRMPALNGIELGNVLRRFAAPPAIVFVTAFEEYAVRAFEIGACDYLLKPVSGARLSTALGRALGRAPDHPDSLDDDPSATIPVETAGRTRFIPREQVRWVEAEGDYVRLHTTDGSAYLLRMPISHLEERWSVYGFIRIHRGFLVQVKHITEFSVTNGVHAVTVAGHTLPVSRRHVRDVRDWILRAGRRSLPCPRVTSAGPRATRRCLPPVRLGQNPQSRQDGSALSGGPIRYSSNTTFPDLVTCATIRMAVACSSGRSCARSLACPSCA
jgi:DNA-binding LytR/AlgR family response regulator